MSYSIYPINPLTLNLPFIVFSIGSEDNQPHVFRKEGFPVPQIFICISGEGTLKVKDQVFHLERGAFFFLTANTPHEYYGTTEKWEVMWIAFSGNQIDAILTELKFDDSKVGVLSNINNTESLFKRILGALKTDDTTGKLIASSTLYEILVDFYIMLYKKQEEDALIENGIIAKLKLYIDDHYNQNLTLEELSLLFNITPQYLCKLFKKHLNLRPFQYIAMKRIQHAKKMLSENKLSVNDIAHLVGYNDCSYFCAVFKKYEMISPTEFRGL